MNVFEGFAEKMDTLSNKTDTKITLLVSADAADLPEAIAKFAERAFDFCLIQRKKMALPILAVPFS